MFAVGSSLVNHIFFFSPGLSRRYAPWAGEHLSVARQSRTWGSLGHDCKATVESGIAGSCYGFPHRKQPNKTQADNFCSDSAAAVVTHLSGDENASGLPAATRREGIEIFWWLRRRRFIWNGWRLESPAPGLYRIRQAATDFGSRGVGASRKVHVGLYRTSVQCLEHR